MILVHMISSRMILSPGMVCWCKLRSIHFRSHFRRTHQPSCDDCHGLLSWFCEWQMKEARTRIPLLSHTHNIIHFISFFLLYSSHGLRCLATSLPKLWDAWWPLSSYTKTTLLPLPQCKAPLLLPSLTLLRLLEILSASQQRVSLPLMHGLMNFWVRPSWSVTFSSLQTRISIHRRICPLLSFFSWLELLHHSVLRLDLQSIQVSAKDYYSLWHVHHS